MHSSAYAFASKVITLWCEIVNKLVKDSEEEQQNHCSVNLKLILTKKNKMVDIPDFNPHKYFHCNLTNFGFHFIFVP